MLQKKSFLFAIILFFAVKLHAQVPDSIPPFHKFKDYEHGATFSRDSLNKDHKQVFILYDAGCGHCQELGYEFSKAIPELDSLVDYYFIAMQEKPLVEGYINMFAKDLKNYSNVKFLHDPEGEFILNFHPKNFPATYIYDRKTFKLLFQVDGESKVVKMLPFLKKQKQ
ncbi:hypothetical protein [Sphingobacterium sp. CZ-2]|uniref:hypothetical protein n=1 Tax=Sphingobacterium sp. CZ-2 TaxID=2557994 RepID=UPI00106F91B9|nr:hypothetical protein [Sphingobacterium sp. CZ-2]QBR12667.1 hypothetical protein E3D81_11050 [Sphingobacterium sp. CZ-2]